MADPICRWRNSSIKQLNEFNILFPRKVINKTEGRKIVEKNWALLGGKDFFTTPYQLAAQMGVYYEDDSHMYPRFSSIIDLNRCNQYMQNWGRKYYAPNPYTRSMQSKQPIVINNYLVNWVIEHGDGCDFGEALQTMFSDSIGNTDILINMINGFMDIKIEDNKVYLKEGVQFKQYSKEDVYLDKNPNDKKTFFEYIGGTDFKTNLQSDLLYPCQIIFYGAPGTGKSHTINEITEQQPKENVFRTTFHPDSDYSTFVGCYKPTKEKSRQNVKQAILDYDSLVDKFKEYLSVPNANITKVCTQFGFDYHDSIVRIQEQGRKVMDLVNDAYKSNTSYDSVVRGGMACYEQVSSRVSGGSITYSFVPQSFTKAYLRAWQTTEPVYLVIEEINRGNCAQIFGDLFQLLDRKCDGFSEYPIKADNDLAAYIAEELSSSPRTDIPELVKSGEELMLPSNLYIWATMNTSDQSLFPIDSAFKRRWDWKYVPIDTNKERWSINADGASYDWSDFLEKINAKIESATSSEDKMLGFYFCKAENNIVSAERFVNKVLFYLWNDVFRDYGFDDAVFNDENNNKIAFRKFYKADGKIDETLVKKFLDKLGVNIINDNEETIEVDDIDENNPVVANKNHLKNITFADGTIFSTNDMGPFDAYIEAIKKIGVDNVYSIVDKLKYRRLKHPLVSKEKYPEIENSTSYSYVQVGEYYFVKGSKTYTLVRMLEDIKNLLSIDMTINC